MTVRKVFQQAHKKTYVSLLIKQVLIPELSWLLKADRLLKCARTGAALRDELVRDHLAATATDILELVSHHPSVEKLNKTSLYAGFVKWRFT